MRWIDGHLDLAYLAVCGRDMRCGLEEPTDGCVSLPALRQAGIDLVFGTIFTEPTDGEPSGAFWYRAGDVESAEAAGLRQLEIYEQWQRANEIGIVHRAADLEMPNGPLKIVLLMEGADPIRSPEHVPAWYGRGLRIVGLTWALGTRYAGGNAGAPGAGRLTSLGIEMIHALDAASIIHDVSHLSDAAFDGVLEHANGRIIASHSNCRALLEPKQRHLRDDQIKAIADRGGVIGLNLYSAFLATGRRATIDDCIAHLEHVAEVMNHRRGVALGSDMDGGFKPHHLPEGLDHPSKLAALAEALGKAGWSEEEIAGFAHGNWRRLLHEAL